MTVTVFGYSAVLSSSRFVNVPESSTSTLSNCKNLSVAELPVLNQLLVVISQAVLLAEFHRATP